MVLVPHSHGPRGPARSALGAVVLWLALCPALTAAAGRDADGGLDRGRGDGASAADRAERAGDAGRRLDPPDGPLSGVARRGDLQRRVAFHLSSLGVMRQMASPLNPMRDQVMYEEMLAGVEHGAEKATRRALGEYLLESTNLASVIERIKGRTEGQDSGPDGEPGLARRGGADFGVRFYRGLPLLEMRYELQRTNVRLKISPKGAVGFDLSAPRTDRARVSFTFDGDDTVRLNCRLGM